jgi:hypothetical protein
MNKIPTAEEFLQQSPLSHYYDDKTDRMVCFDDEVKTAMIEFAKLHVKAALEAAANSNFFKFDSMAECNCDSDINAILTAYPEHLIQ